MFDPKQGFDSSKKMQSLMDLVKLMKQMHGESAMSSQDDSQPHAMEVEMHAHSADPKELAALEEATHADLDSDQEEGEPEAHKTSVLGKSMTEEVPEESAEEVPESPEEEASESDSDEAAEDSQEPEDEDQHSEMQIPEGLLKLLAAKLQK